MLTLLKHAQPQTQYILLTSPIQNQLIQHNPKEKNNRSQDYAFLVVKAWTMEQASGIGFACCITHSSPFALPCFCDRSSNASCSNPSPCRIGWPLFFWYSTGLQPSYYFSMSFPGVFSSLVISYQIAALSLQQKSNLNYKIDAYIET